MFSTQPTRTLRSYIARAARLPLGALAGVALAAAISPATFSAAQVAPLPTVDPAATLVEAHDCWTGAQPADVTIPGHVVVSRAGGPQYRGEHMVDLALRQVFNGEAHGLTVHAFCR